VARPARPPSRRSILAGGLGAAGLGAFGLFGAACRHQLARDPHLAGRRGDRHGDWSLISPRAELDQLTRVDVVVVGSGYGGAVAATRLAERGARVVVLERGLEWLPGDFPEEFGALMAATRDLDGDGLYDLYMPAGSDLDVVSASGVGGTSLINAAISVRPPANVFVQRDWPEAIRAAHADGSLAGYFERAEAVLQPARYPGELPAKAAQLRAVAAARGGGRFDLLPLSVTYRDQVRGAPGVAVRQSACTLCGNCTVGCNHAAKSTLQTSYLPLARAAGARVFAGVEVDHLERRTGGWRVHYQARGRSPHAASLDADLVVVAAGALGSSEILLRSRARGLPLSDALGTRVSANGDLMGVCYNGTLPTAMIGEAEGAVSGMVGTALMGYVDHRDPEVRGPELQDQFLLIESTIPVALANAAAKAMATWAGFHRDRFSAEQLRRVDLDTAEVGSHDPAGALTHTTLYLACGHDDSGGRYLHRDGDRPRIEWPGVGRSRFVASIFAEMKAHTEILGGVFIPNPRTTLFGGRVMAPHPLGGAPMADHVRAGVVDHLGRVFDPAGGVYRGLAVLDGSIVPRSLAATPLLTITALAERGVEQLATG